MESRCAFSSCKHYSDDYFCSPSDPILLKQWQLAANTKERDFCVCINHFKKRDVLVEKTLETCAVPIRTDMRLNRNSCGSCLVDLDSQITMPNRETSKIFFEITEYQLVTDLLCIKCSHFLKNFSKFKNEIKEKQRKLRMLNNIDKLQSNVPPKNTMRSCPHCSYKSFSNDDYNLHLCTVHGVMLKIGTSEILGSCTVDCFYCNKQFKTDAELQAHQAKYHSKSTSERQKSSIIIKSPRSLASSASNLDKKRLQLIAKLENSMKKRTQPVLKEAAICIPTPTATRSTRPRQSVRKQNENFEIFEYDDEITIKDEMIDVEVEIKEEVEDKSPAVEIRNVDEILGNKSRRKQNIAKAQTKPDIVFKEEAEHEDEFIVAEVADDEEEVSHGSSESENDDEMLNSLNYIPPPKKSRVSALPKQNSQVQCLDCGEYMDVDELADHRDIMHNKSEQQAYDDIRNSDLPPAPPKKYNKTKQPKSITPLPCNVCSRVMPEWKLQKHVELFHGDNPLPFLCHICSKSFAQVTMFKYHMAGHDPELQFRCDMCGKGFIRKSRMLNHIKRSHMKIFTEKFTCPICNQKIYKQHRVKKHTETYHPKSAEWPNGLDEGYRVNPETNFFDCYRCGASYADLYTMKRHDCGKGRYQMRCPDCRKPVKNEESLQKHRETKCPRLNKNLGGRLWY